MAQKIKLFVKGHYLALILAFLVGLVAVAPNFLYIIYLGNDYKGGHFFSTANEDSYLAKMQEIIDGHWRVGSPVFFEYKDFHPLVPPVAEYLYALPSLLFKIPLVKTVVFSKFLLPALLFLLVYFFIYQLTLNKDSLSAKINAAVGGIFVTLGFGLIDIKTTWLLLSGKIDSASLLLWTRPVNPIIGALLIFTLLLIIWSIVNRRKKYLFIPAGIVSALMVGYFFTWGLSLAVAAMLILLFLIKKDYYAVKQLGLTVLVAFLASFPYWYNLFKTLLQSNDKNLAAKNGLFYTHAPVINKVLLTISLIFLLFTWYKLRRGEKLKAAENNWWWLCLAMILGGWLAYNQQILTGRTIWYYHFVQYTIPFAIVIGMIILGNFFRLKFFKVWLGVVAIILLLITAYNVKSFVNYPKSYEASKSDQAYTSVFNWLNKNAAKDCVVLIDDPTGSVGIKLSALTHCDTYLSNWVFEGAPAERVYHNYLVLLRLKGITGDQVKNYLLLNKENVRVYFFENWDQIYALKADDGWLYKKINQISADYKKFVKQDLTKELKKYRLDYIAAKAEADKKIKALLPDLKLIGNLDGIYLYKF